MCPEIVDVVAQWFLREDLVAQVRCNLTQPQCGDEDECDGAKHEMTTPAESDDSRDADRHQYQDSHEPKELCPQLVQSEERISMHCTRSHGEYQEDWNDERKRDSSQTHERRNPDHCEKDDEADPTHSEVGRYEW
ncbi:MAG: hypothetical protein QOF40_1658, partial [Actinomycetota bacterium]|nr:hypothetical protein [Actinomycetota bacterium]